MLRKEQQVIDKQLPSILAILTISSTYTNTACRLRRKALLGHSFVRTELTGLHANRMPVQIPVS